MLRPIQTRLLDPEEVLRRQVVSFVDKGDFGFASGPRSGDGFVRVSWKGTIGPGEVTFDDKTFLLTRERAASLKQTLVQPPLTAPPPGPDLVLEPPSTPAVPAEKPVAEAPVRLTLRGAIPPEQWTKLGTRPIPKLRSSSQDLSLSPIASFTVGSTELAHVEAELHQALRDLGLGGQVRFERERV